MKKNKKHSLLFAFIACLSLGAYIYLNTVEIPQPKTVKTEIPPKDNNGDYLPDVKVMKKAVTLVKKFVPSS